MKKLLLFCLGLSLLCSCNKKSNQGNPEPVQVYPPAHFIPNWHDNDTLLSYYTDNTGDHWDTMFTRTAGDTSEIIYAGQMYYIWKQPLSVDDTFRDNQPLYGNCCINTIPFDTNNAVAYSEAVLIRPSKYYDSNNGWVHQHQVVVVDNVVHFKSTHLGEYYSDTVY